MQVDDEQKLEPIRIGFLVLERKRVVGQGAFSPGLEYDAQVMKNEFERLGAHCSVIPPWCAGRQVCCVCLFDNLFLFLVFPSFFAAPLLLRPLTL